MDHELADVGKDVVEYALGSAMTRAGELVRRPGPGGLPAVLAASSGTMPRLRNSSNLVRPRFHCFHNTDRSRRGGHRSSACSTVGESSPRNRTGRLIWSPRR